MVSGLRNLVWPIGTSAVGVVILSLGLWQANIWAQDKDAVPESDVAAVKNALDSAAVSVSVDTSTANAPTESPTPSVAATSMPTYDTGSIAWMLVSSALVFFMMPGLALFYGGMVRSKNLLNMFMCVMVCVPLIAVQWIAYGYSLAFAVPSAIASDAEKNPDGS